MTYSSEAPPPKQLFTEWLCNCRECIPFAKYVTLKAVRIIAMPKLRKIVKTAVLVTPVLITVYDQVGYVGIVRGSSMRVRHSDSPNYLYSIIFMHIDSVAYTEPGKLKVDRFSSG